MARIQRSKDYIEICQGSTSGRALYAGFHLKGKRVEFYGHGAASCTPKQAHRLADELHRLADRAEKEATK